MRKPILAGNWKMNKTRDAAIHFILEVEPKLPKDNVDVIICAPAILLRDLVKRSDVIKVGAQNMNEHDSGAYTGEISPIMLKDTKVEYVILGHSERRAYYNETDATVNAKIKKALEFELKPIVCVGETLEQRESGKTSDVLSNQIKKAFDGISIENPENVIIAYEPIWAIGPSGGKCHTLCMTHPKVRELILAQLIEYIEADRKARKGQPPYNFPQIYDISQPDGASGAECWCENCRKLAKAEGSYAGPNIDFINYLASGIKDKYPEILLRTFAYSR